jgi:galactose mutarotase-like enzyme
MSVSVEAFGSYKGQQVDQFKLTSDTGVEVDIITYGVAVRDWRVPVAGGKRSVVLGFDNFDDYPAHSPHFGSLAGRVANRISGASFEIDGKTYRVPANQGSNSLHGGPEGLGLVVWNGEADSAGNRVRFTHHSPDGAMGFPGNVDFTAIYTLSGNRLRLELTAVTDKKTPISLVQHQYFNLGTSDDVLDQSQCLYRKQQSRPHSHRSNIAGSGHKIRLQKAQDLARRRRQGHRLRWQSCARQWPRSCRSGGGRQWARQGVDAQIVDRPARPAVL